MENADIESTGFTNNLLSLIHLGIDGQAEWASIEALAKKNYWTYEQARQALENLGHMPEQDLPKVPEEVEPDDYFDKGTVTVHWVGAEDPEVEDHREEKEEKSWIPYYESLADD